ncbi:MAG: class I SAM-dependent methyltransferase [Thermodesulfobacteriota bacterium]
MENNIEGNGQGNVDRIMDRIRRRIAEKMESGAYSAADREKIDKTLLQVQREGAEDQEGDIQYRLSQLNYLCNTARPPEFISHRKVLGPMVNGIKKVLRKLTDPYVQTVLKRQVEFNVELVRLLNQIGLDFRFRWSTLEKRLDQLDQQGTDMTRALEALPRELQTQKNIFEEVLNQIQACQAAPGEGTLATEALRGRLTESEYARFEDRHRGSEEAVKWKQRNYLTYFQDRGPVLDLGCGRGEFLELLREAGIPARGVDNNQEMVLRCRDKGLEVVQEDGWAYLQAAADHSLGGIFLSQVIEHLGPEMLREWVRVGFKKLRPKGLLLAETINPQCLSTFSGAFYLDLSHKNPIHPEAARYLWESLGFQQVEILYVSPFPEEMKLKEMVRREDDSYEDELARLFNENVRGLNALLYGYQDYAVLGYK